MSRATLNIRKLRRLLLSFVLLTASAMSCVLEVSDREREAYIQGTEGPYRGRVVDARTKEPIRGAVVLATWIYDVYALVQTNQQFYDAVEVLTNDEGFFVVDAPRIERRAPWRTQFPEFTIFKPGYRYFKGWFASPKDMAQRKNKALLGVVELESITPGTKRDLLRNLPSPPPSLAPAEAHKKIPRFLEAIKEQETKWLR